MADLTRNNSPGVSVRTNFWSQILCVLISGFLDLLLQMPIEGHAQIVGLATTVSPADPHPFHNVGAINFETVVVFRDRSLSYALMCLTLGQTHT